MPSRSGGELLVANLIAQGTTHAFGVPGESFPPVFDALYDVADRLTFVVCRQECGAAYMAAACQALARAQRPILLVGASRWDRDGCAAWRVLAERAGLPVACAFRHQDLFDNRHPQYAGDVGIAINPQLAERVRNADVLLVV